MVLWDSFDQNYNLFIILIGLITKIGPQILFQNVCTILYFSLQYFTYDILLHFNKYMTFLVSACIHLEDAGSHLPWGSHFRLLCKILFWHFFLKSASKITYFLKILTLVKKFFQEFLPTYCVSMHWYKSVQIFSGNLVNLIKVHFMWSYGYLKKS